MSIYTEIAKREPHKFFKSRYKGMFQRSGRRCHVDPNFTLEEFITWLRNQPKLTELWEAYQASEYDTALAPSVDRIDDNLPYTLSNMQLMTWGDNHAKLPRKSLTLSKDEQNLEFDSVTEAAVFLNVSTGALRNAKRRGGKCQGYIVKEI